MCRSFRKTLLFTIGLLTLPFIASIARAQAVAIRVELVEIHCNKDKNTEDITGADEFYFVSAFKSGSLQKAVVSTPFDINTDQTKTFSEKDKILFAGDVSTKESIEGGIVAYDEDFGKDWENKYKAITKEIASGISKGVASDKENKNGPLVAILIGAVTSVVDLLAQSDKDDELGQLSIKVDAEGPAEELKEWKFEHADGIGYSDWSYVLKYKVTRSKK